MTNPHRSQPPKSYSKAAPAVREEHPDGRTKAADAPTNHVAPAIIVDPDLAVLIRPHTEDERGALEKSLLVEGCRDPLVVWEGANILLDGRLRLDLWYQAHHPIQDDHDHIADKRGSH